TLRVCFRIRVQHNNAMYGPAVEGVPISSLLMSLFLTTRNAKQIRMKTNAEATVALQLNQGTTKGMGRFIPFLIFLWLLSFHQGKESDNTASGKVLKNGSSAKYL